jgi:hypothetical protein
MKIGDPQFKEKDSCISSACSFGIGLTTLSDGKNHVAIPAHLTANNENDYINLTFQNLPGSKLLCCQKRRCDHASRMVLNQTEYECFTQSKLPALSTAFKTTRCDFAFGTLDGNFPEISTSGLVAAFTRFGIIIPPGTSMGQPCLSRSALLGKIVIKKSLKTGWTAMRVNHVRTRESQDDGKGMIVGHAIAGGGCPLSLLGDCGAVWYGYVSGAIRPCIFHLVGDNV